MTERGEREPTPREYALPDVGEGLLDAEIVAWRVAVGDSVAVNDILVEIETAKSVVELPSPYAGIVAGLLVEEGVTVPVGTPIVAISGSADPGAVAKSDTKSESGREPTLVGYGARTSGPRRRRKVPTHVGSVVPLRTGTDEHGHRRVRVKPPVRKLAKDLGIDVNDVPASGPVVTRADVEAYAAARSSHPSAELSKPGVESMSIVAGNDVRVPVRGVRKAMADAMVTSVRTAPHATEWLTIDISRTVEFIGRLQKDPAFGSIRVTPTVAVAKAVCLALRHAPTLNASWIESKSGEHEVLMHGSVNLGIAVDTERGLLVPNIKEAERLSLLELARELDHLTSTARHGRTQPADQVGGTFTITNVGVFGIDAGTPILNLGESGILAVGAIQRRPWVAEDDTIVPRWVTTLALSFDHRIADGAEAARFLTDVSDILSDPARALTY